MLFHPLANNRSASINERVINDCSQGIFEMIVSIIELVKELVDKKNLIFRK